MCLNRSSTLHVSLLYESKGHFKCERKNLWGRIFFLRLLSFFLSFFCPSLSSSVLCVTEDSWIRNGSLVEEHSLHHRHDLTPFLSNPLGAICAQTQCTVSVCVCIKLRLSYHTWFAWLLFQTTTCCSAFLTHMAIIGLTKNVAMGINLLQKTSVLLSTDLAQKH